MAGSPGAQDQRRSGVIRVQTDLVNILVSVLDANGEPVPDLTQDAFQLAEEGVPQKIERFEAETNRPLDLALMVDSSMSTFKDMKFETEAAAHFIRQVVRPGDTLGVFEFSERSRSWHGFQMMFRNCSRRFAESPQAAELPCTMRWCWAQMN